MGAQDHTALTLELAHTIDVVGGRTPPSSASVRAARMSPDGSTLAIELGEAGWALYSVGGGPPFPLPSAIDVQPGRRGAEMLVVEPALAYIRTAGEGCNRLIRRRAYLKGKYRQCGGTKPHHQGIST